MTSPQRIVLIDGYSQIYRAFYAIRNLSNARGEPTNALFGFARFLLRVERDIPHAFGALVLDKGKCTKRLEVLPEYKATRPPMPDALRSQIGKIRDWVDAAGWAIMEWEGIEADDIIAAVADAAESCDVAVLSSDKDLAQLVRPGVSLFIPGKKGGLDELDPEGVAEKFGVPPDAVRDYLALVGDSVDNIAGIEGVGPKTAAKLLNECGSLDDILANPERVPNVRLREKLIAGRERLKRNVGLVGLMRELPPGWSGVAGIRRRPPDYYALLRMADENGFKSVAADLRKQRDAERNPTLF